MKTYKIIHVDPFAMEGEDQHGEFNIKAKDEAEAKMLFKRALHLPLSCIMICFPMA